mmetsp:Transcript_4793/g.7119  ORF Transcript_4793/g.7119 Transcript_4793/m.7119 type:complete len:301 (-) Transcript_4793:570-1472(-)
MLLLSLDGSEHRFSYLSCGDVREFVDAFPASCLFLFSPLLLLANALIVVHSRQSALLLLALIHRVPWGTAMATSPNFVAFHKSSGYFLAPASAASARLDLRKYLRHLVRSNAHVVKHHGQIRMFSLVAAVSELLQGQLVNDCFDVFPFIGFLLGHIGQSDLIAEVHKLLSLADGHVPYLEILDQQFKSQVEIPDGLVLALFRMIALLLDSVGGELVVEVNEVSHDQSNVVDWILLFKSLDASLESCFSRACGQGLRDRHHKLVVTLNVVVPSFECRFERESHFSPPLIAFTRSSVVRIEI